MTDVSTIAEQVCAKRLVDWQLLIVTSSRSRGGKERFIVTVHPVGRPQRKGEGPTVESATNLAINEIGK